MAESNDEYKFDVAISFLHQDEPIALDLYERLSPNFEVFVYTEKQEELSGTDGLESFRKAFREDSRLVIALYRDGWGKTPWTRVEEGAIKDRFLKEGWDWMLFIMLDDKSTPPPWLPETRIRLSLPDYGIEQAVGVIKSRLQELGSCLRKEDAVQRARRLEQQVASRAKRKRLLSSSDGVKAVEKEVESVHSEITRLTEEIKRTTGNLKLLAVSVDDISILTNERVSVRVTCQPWFRDSLEKPHLVVTEFNGRVPLPGDSYEYVLFPEARQLSVHHFDPDITSDKEWCWRLQSEPKRHYTSAEVADYCVTLFLHLIDRADKGDLPPLDDS